MKKMVKYLGLLIVSLLLVACGNGNGDGGDQSDIQVGYAINNLNDTFQTYILEAATEIWCDNGRINRHEPYGVKVELLNQWLMTLDSNELMLAETELSKLSEDDLHTLCCGEETEQERIGSPFINEFLNRIFDEEYEPKAARDGNE